MLTLAVKEKTLDEIEELLDVQSYEVSSSGDAFRLSYQQFRPFSYNCKEFVESILPLEYFSPNEYSLSKHVDELS